MASTQWFKSAIAAATLTWAMSPVAQATPVEFQLNDSLALTQSYSVTHGDLSLTVTGFRANDSSAWLNLVPFLGVGIKSSIFDSFQVNGGEYLVFQFSQTVTLTNYLLCDNHLLCPESSFWKNDGDRFLINGVNLPTDNRLLPVDFAGIGPVDTFVFATTGGDAFRVKSITVTAVPEPEVLLMTLAGLGVVGWSASRRRQA